MISIKGGHTLNTVTVVGTKTSLGNLDVQNTEVKDDGDDGIKND